MAVEAPICKFKKNNIAIYILICIVFAVWFGYDGYYNEKFRKEHSKADGTPDSTLVFNQKSPPFFIGAAVLIGAYLLVIRKKKITAGENELVLCNGKKVPYNSIQKIDKTHFEKKGFFVITYKNELNKEINRKISGRKYDNLKAVLNEIVAKIS